MGFQDSVHRAMRPLLLLLLLWASLPRRRLQPPVLPNVAQQLAQTGFDPDRRPGCLKYSIVSSGRIVTLQAMNGSIALDYARKRVGVVGPKRVKKCHRSVERLVTGRWGPGHVKLRGGLPTEDGPMTILPDLVLKFFFDMGPSTQQQA